MYNYLLRGLSQLLRKYSGRKLQCTDVLDISLDRFFQNVGLIKATAPFHHKVFKEVTIANEQPASRIKLLREE